MEYTTAVSRLLHTLEPLPAERARRDTRDYPVCLREQARAGFDRGEDPDDFAKKVDQPKFIRLANFSELATRNANAVFLEIERESFNCDAGMYLNLPSPRRPSSLKLPCPGVCGLPDRRERAHACHDRGGHVLLLRLGAWARARARTLAGTMRGGRVITGGFSPTHSYNSVTCAGSRSSARPACR